jgi:LacI family transcriptional regulator
MPVEIARSGPAAGDLVHATIWDVAREARTSKSTVSKVLRGQPHVAASTRMRVQDAIDRLGYRPNAAARSLVQRRAHVLGIVVTDIRNPFFGEIAHAIAEAAGAAGYSTILSDLSMDRPGASSFLDLVLEGRADALVFAAWPGAPGAARRLREASFPIAFVGCRPLGGVGADWVAVDEERGVAMAVRHLVELGHRRIACIASAEDDAADRIAGYRAGLAAARLHLDDSLIVRADPAADEADFGSLAGYRAARTLLGVQPRATAILAADDFLALGAMQALEEAGVLVPRDMSLVGFDDIQFAGLSRIGLTTVGQPRALMGRRIAELVLDRLDTRGPAVPRGILLEPTLIVRGSTGPPPARTD